MSSSSRQETLQVNPKEEGKRRREEGMGADARPEQIEKDTEAIERSERFRKANG